MFTNKVELYKMSINSWTDCQVKEMKSETTFNDLLIFFAC